MKAERGEEAAAEMCDASGAWFTRLKERRRLRDTDAQGEAASARGEAAARYPEDPAQIVRVGGHPEPQMFGADGSASCRGKMPCGTLVAGEEKSMPDLKASRDRPTLPLGASAAGVSGWKPLLVDRSENPRGPENYAKPTRPVLRKWNNKARMTAHLFTTWSVEGLEPAVETRCSGKKIPFKMSLLVGSAPGHPRALMAWRRTTR